VGIEIANESGTVIPEGSIAAAARFAMDQLGVSPLAELSVLLVGSGVMADLHQRWMDLPGPTDVMAFPIVLCPEVAIEQAAAAGHALLDELHLLTVHGVLHLLGYDHADPAEEREMFSLQDGILAEFRRADLANRRRIAQRDADTRLLGVVGLDGPQESGPPG
jgi:probable rRNA maturation factor